MITIEFLEKRINMLELTMDQMAGKGIYTLYHEQEDARRCIEFMKYHRIDSVESIGPFIPLTHRNIKPGSYVWVKKGAKLNGTGKDMGVREQGKISGRKYKIRVHNLFKGYTVENHDHSRVFNTKVSWAGTGGYWIETDIHNVEPV